MFGLGVGELAIILVVVLILFGPGRLPELGSALGEGIKNFKKGYRDSKALDVTPPENMSQPPSNNHDTATGGQSGTSTSDPAKKS